MRLVHNGLRTGAVRLVHSGLKAAAAGLDHSGLREAAVGLALQADEGMLQQCVWCDALVTVQMEHPLQQIREAGWDRLVWLGSFLQVKSEMTEKMGQNMANTSKSTT